LTDDGYMRCNSERWWASLTQAGRDMFSVEAITKARGRA
jgi:hypothetical protein